MSQIVPSSSDEQPKPWVELGSCGALRHSQVLAVVACCCCCMRSVGRFSQGFLFQDRLNIESYWIGEGLRISLSKGFLPFFLEIPQKSHHYRETKFMYHVMEPLSRDEKSWNHEMHIIFVRLCFNASSPCWSGPCTSGFRSWIQFKNPPGPYEVLLLLTFSKKSHHLPISKYPSKHIANSQITSALVELSLVHPFYFYSKPIKPTTKIRFLKHFWSPTLLSNLPGLPGCDVSVKVDCKLASLRSSEFHGRSLGPLNEGAVSHGGTCTKTVVCLGKDLLKLPKSSKIATFSPRPNTITFSGQKEMPYHTNTSRFLNRVWFGAFCF